jgi:hypothetical protein
MKKLPKNIKEKSKLKKLIKLSQSEIKEWQKFLKICIKKLEKLDK